MIASAWSPRVVVRLFAPLVWRTPEKMAAKLEGFAATEAGSALDMLKAAELTDDPELRWLFFRHAMDEARHAQMFRAEARRLAGVSPARRSQYDLIRATRQNLYERLGLVRFIAFVYLAERRGEAQFRGLAEHFADDPELARLFGRIGKDEKFHVSYTHMLLARWHKEGRRAEVRRALWQVRGTRALDAWRRSGRRIGDLLAKTLLTLIYLVVLPLFVVVQRIADPARPGWRRSRRLSESLAAAKRQY
jgi:rubrerythrin